jgi:hypothetical protein
VGAGSRWHGAVTLVLLLATNYLVAAVVAALVERLARSRAGNIAAALAVAMSVLFMFVLPFHGTAGTSRILVIAHRALRATPPIVAARAMTSEGWPFVGWTLALVAWSATLACAVAAIGRLRLGPQRATPSIGAVVNVPYDLCGAPFGQSFSPLTGKMLRYLIRSAKVRASALVTLPALLMMIMATGSDGQAFPMAIGFIAFFAGMAGGGVGLNLFGLDGAGFRRYLLSPVRLSRVLLLASMTALLPGALTIPVLLLLWLLLSPSQTDLDSIAMLASSGAVGLLVFATCGVWTSILSPVKMPFDRTLGNRLSTAANAVVVLGVAAMFPFLVVVRVFRIDNDALAHHWWIGGLLLLPAVSAYVGSVYLGAGMMYARRERMLEVFDPT